MVVPPLHHRLKSAAGKSTAVGGGGFRSRGVDGELDLAVGGAAFEGVGAASHGAGVPGAVDAPPAAANAAGVAAAAVVMVVDMAHEEGPISGGATAPTAAAPSPLTVTVVGDGDMSPTN